MLIIDLVIGSADELMLKVYKLHFPKPKGRQLRVADVTYGHGVFWKQIDTSKFDFFPLDRDAGKKKIDFRKLPYADDFLDVGVFDPHGSAFVVGPIASDAYRAIAWPVDGAIPAGMTELHRALRPRGVMLVRCQDIFHGGKQIRLTEMVRHLAVESLGMTDVDKFHLFCSFHPPAIYGRRQKLAPLDQRDVDFPQMIGLPPAPLTHA